MRLRSLALSLLAAAIVLTAGLTFATQRPRARATRTVATGAAATIKITNYAYEPARLTVRVGTRITVTNDDQTQHTLTAARGGAFDTGTIQPGGSATFVVSKAGVYPYLCQFHAFMMGSLTVVR